MPDNTNDPILPIPSDLYRAVGKLHDRIDEMRDELVRIRTSYRALQRSPESLAVDNLGEPITPADATASVLTGLTTVSERLDGVERAVDEAHQPASRLKLTDQADKERDRRIAHQRRGTRRSR